MINRRVDRSTYNLRWSGQKSDWTPREPHHKRIPRVQTAMEEQSRKTRTARDAGHFFLCRCLFAFSTSLVFFRHDCLDENFITAEIDIHVDYWVGRSLKVITFFVACGFIVRERYSSAHILQ